MSDQQSAYAAKADAQLKVWKAQLDVLVAKAEKAGAKVNLEYRKKIEDLKAKQEMAQTKLSELREAGAEKWEILKGGLEDARRDLGRAFHEMKPAAPKA